MSVKVPPAIIHLRKGGTDLDCPLATELVPHTTTRIAQVTCPRCIAIASGKQGRPS